jgi:hypothetical protein
LKTCCFICEKLDDIDRTLYFRFLLWQWQADSGQVSGCLRSNKNSFCSGILRKQLIFAGTWAHFYAFKKKKRINTHNLNLMSFYCFLKGNGFIQTPTVSDITGQFAMGVCIYLRRPLHSLLFVCCCEGVYIISFMFHYVQFWTIAHVSFLISCKGF